MDASERINQGARCKSPVLHADTVLLQMSLMKPRLTCWSWHYVTHKVRETIWILQLSVWSNEIFSTCTHSVRTNHVKPRSLASAAFVLFLFKNSLLTPDTWAPCWYFSFDWSSWDCICQTQRGEELRRDFSQIWNLFFFITVTCKGDCCQVERSV